MSGSRAEAHQEGTRGERPRVAITRGVSSAIGRCELTHLARATIDVEFARAQHRRYEDLLESLGCELVRLPAEPSLPDSVFVEDTAVVLDEVALVARPGAPSRRAEVAAVAAILERHRPLIPIDSPATLDGGDVLVVGRRLFVGLSRRTVVEAIDQVRRLLGPVGYEVIGVPVTGCLHLKSAATLVHDETILLNPRWTDAVAFTGLALIEVDPREPFAANALRVGDAVVYPAAFPETRRRLEARGLRVEVVDLSELAKAEGAVTCCSLLVENVA